MSTRHRDIAPEPSPEIAVHFDARRRSGHRQELTGRGDRRSARDRSESALVDIAVFRSVAYKDVAAVHYDNHPYAARRAIDKLKAQGLISEHTIRPPKADPFKVLAPTKQGAATAATSRTASGLDPQQKYWSGLGRRGDLSHDVAIFRAVRAASAELKAQGATVHRVRLDGELRGLVARRTETARARSGKAAAAAERRRLAAAYELPIKPTGELSFPDAQIEYTLTDEQAGATCGRVNIEVTTHHYSPAAVAAKAAAGFALFGASGKAMRNILKLAKSATGPETAARGGSSQRDESFDF